MRYAIEAGGPRRRVRGIRDCGAWVRRTFVKISEPRPGWLTGVRCRSAWSPNVRPPVQTAVSLILIVDSSCPIFRYPYVIQAGGRGLRE